MKTQKTASTSSPLVSFLVSLSTYLSILLAFSMATAGLGAPNTTRWSMDQARKLSSWLLQVQQKNRLSGVYFDQTSNNTLFNEVEKRLDSEFTRGRHRLLKLEASPGSVKLKIQWENEKTPVEMIAYSSTRSTQGQVKKSIRFSEVLGLIVQEVQSFQDPVSGHFVTLTQSLNNSKPGIVDHYQIEMGKKFDAFTLSMFSRRITIANNPNHLIDQSGVALTIPVVQYSGWELAVRAEASYGQESHLELFQGRMTSKKEGALNGSLRVELTKSFKYSGISTGVGFKLLYTGANGFHQEPLRVAFFRISKSFTNKRGQEILNINLIGTQRFGEVPAGSQRDGMIAISIGGEF